MKFNFYQHSAIIISKNLGLPEDNREVLAYGLETLVTTVAGTVLALTAAALLGVFYQTLVVFVISGAIKKLAGGAHLSSPWRCFAASTISLCALGWLSLLLFWWLPAAVILTLFLLAVGLALGTTARFAPADTVAKPIANLQRRHFLRRAALTTEVFLAVLGLLLFLVGYLPRWGLAAAALGFAWQALFITPVGYRLMGSLDLLIGRFTRNRKEVQIPCGN